MQVVVWTSEFSVSCLNIKGVQRPAAFAIVSFCFSEFRTVIYSGSFTQSMLVFVVLPLSTVCEPFNLLRSSQCNVFNVIKSHLTAVHVQLL